MKAKICIIGNFGNWKCKGDGQTVKTLELYNYLRSVYKENVIYMDVCKEIGVFSRIKNFLKAIFRSENIIIILSYKGYFTILPIIQFFQIFFRYKTFDFVIGGNRYNVLAKHKVLIWLQNKVTKTYVETKKLLKEYKKVGINNCEIIPNFKNINIKNAHRHNTKKKLKVCTFTRVHKDKGILDSIEAVKLANRKMNNNLIELDIYGAIDLEYKEEFNKLQKEFPSYIKYCGMAKSNHATDILYNYDIMLFLTFHVGEGFPGTIVDAFASGLPIIATKWNSNEEIVEEDKTGKLVEIHNIEKVSDLLIEYNNNRKKLEEMSYNCINKAEEYLSENALKTFINEIEKN